MKINILFATTFVTFFAANNIVHAEIDSLNNRIQLEEVVVTANKFPQKYSQTGKVISVLSDSVLQKYQTQSLTEILSKQSGFMIVGAQGAFGTNQDVYFRGSATGNMLVTLDGAPIYDPSTINNSFDLNILNLGECERIEILKGAQSSIYGSGAVAGVMNIFPKTTSSQGLKVQLQYGTYNTFRGNISYAGLFKKGYYNFQYSRLSSDGFSAAYDSTGKKEFDNDGITQNNLLLNFGYRFSRNTKLKFRSLVNQYTADLDGSTYKDTKNYVGKNKLNWFSLGLEHNFRAFVSYMNYSFSGSRRDYENSSSLTTYLSNSHFLDFYNKAKIFKNFEGILGTDFRQNNFTQEENGTYASPISGDSAKINMYSLYVSANYKGINNLNLEGGFRYNNHSIYGSNATYSFTPSFKLNNYVRVFGSLASAFNAPSLYRLYSPYGNKSLKPEATVSKEIGFQISSKDKASSFRALYFDRRIENVFFFSSQGGQTGYGQYINFDKQHDFGAEFEGQISWNKWQLSANMTLLDGNITTKVGKSDTTYNNLIRRPKSMGNIGLSFQANKKWYIRTNIRMVGNRFDQVYKNRGYTYPILASYTTIDLYSEYQVAKSLKLFIDLKNIGNVQYFDITGYNTRQFNMMVGASIQF